MLSFFQYLFYAFTKRSPIIYTINRIILKKGEHIEFSDYLEVEAVIFTLCIYYDLKLSEKIKFGLVPVGTLAISSDGGIHKDLETWVSVKYFPLKREDSFFRFAVKVPFYQPDDFENQVDIDFAVLFAKSFSGFVPEVLFGYRYRFKTHRKPDIDYLEYGAPGNEFHYRIGFNIQKRKTTRGSLFLMGYWGEDKIEYSYDDYFGESKTIYQGSYKLSIGATISQFCKAKGFFPKDTWVNVSVFRGISWRNELGGWGFVLGFGI